MLSTLAAARDPLHRDLKILYRKEFTALGIGLRFETNSPAILEACSAAFRSFGMEQTTPPHFAICLFEDPLFNQTPPWPEPIFRGRRNLFYISIGAENTAVADLEHSLAIGFLSPAMVQDANILRRTFIEGLAFTMATHGGGATHSYIHASAVAKGSKGLILSGPPHAGKSTLAYACARRGFHVIADDVVYLRKGDDKLTAWGNAWRLRLAPESITLFPELIRRTDILDHSRDSDVLEVDLDRILPGCSQPCCEPMALIFLDRSGGSNDCHALDPTDAAKLLARDLISDTPEVMEMHYQMWMKLAQKGSYMLRYSKDLDSAVNTLECLLPSDAAD